MTQSATGHIVCFGEMLLRLAPAGDAGLEQDDALALHVAGSEANVAISLASLGTPARMATVLPDNALGARALGALMHHGVDTASCLRRPGRMGLFFIEKPRAGREGGFFYDRAASAFAGAATAINWETALAGARWLHISGLTAALGDEAVSAMRQAVAAARRHGLSISFDCNYRPLLWPGRERLAASLFREFAGAAHLLFASDWDAGLILGEQAGDNAATRLRSAFPGLRWIASTQRVSHDRSDYLGAMLNGRSGAVTISPTRIRPFIDRVGAGDAFAAGLLHALANDWAEESALQFAHRACLMKHAIPGDFSTLSEAAVKACLPG